MKAKIVGRSLDLKLVEIDECLFGKRKNQEDCLYGNYIA